MANRDKDKSIPAGQEGTTGNGRGINESDVGLDKDAGNMEHGKVGGEGLPDNIDSSADSSSGAGSTGGDVGGGGGTTGGTGNSENTGIPNNAGAGTGIKTDEENSGQS
jgi:hypothetical protein